LATRSGAPNTPPNGPLPSAIQTTHPFIAFKPDNVPPSQSIYLQLNDIIIIKHIANIVFPAFTVNYRYLTPQGEIKEGVKQIFPGFAGAIDQLPLGEAWLLSITIQPTSTPGIGSWVWAQIGIIRGALSANSSQVHSIIWSGYVVQSGLNGWPGTPSKEIQDGPGFIESITGQAVAAGAEVNELVPGFRRWSLLVFRVNFTTSAAVGNRFPRFLIDDGVNTLFLIGTNVAQVASTGVNYHLAPGSQFYNDTQASIIIPAPSPTQLKGGYHIRTNTLGLNAADQYSQLQYQVLEWGAWS